MEKKNKVVKGYKGFDKDLKCRNYQYEIGKEFEEDVIPECCSKGFHFCEYPLDVFSYYAPANNRFCEVEGIGDIARHNEDTKVSTNKIRIGAEVNFEKLTKASIDFIYEHVTRKECKGTNLNSDKSVASNTGDNSVASNTGYKSVASNTGNYSVASNTGNYSVASNTGDNSVASNTGNYSVASNTGNYSVASNTGDNSVASNTGYNSVASNTGDNSVASNTGYNSVASNTGYKSVASNTGYKSVASNTGNYSVASNTGKKGISSSLGIESKAKGSIGTWLVLAEWIDTTGHYDWEVKEVKTIKVDGKKIKEDTLYQLIDGKFVEVKDVNN